jgi:hypothetical protein
MGNVSRDELLRRLAHEAATTLADPRPLYIMIKGLPDEEADLDALADDWWRKEWRPDTP